MLSVGSVVMILNGEYADCVAYVSEVVDGKYKVEVPFIEGSEFTYVGEQDIKFLQGRTIRLVWNYISNKIKDKFSSIFKGGEDNE